MSRSTARFFRSLRIAAVLLAAGASAAFAQFDSIDGPVVQGAQKALLTGNTNYALMWVQPGDEAEVLAAFSQAMAVRGLSPEARALADRYFFETLVRIRSAEDGRPYTGIKPAGSYVDPSVAVADRSLSAERPSPRRLIQALSERLAAGVAERFNAVLEKRRNMDASLQAGRDYAEAYTEFLHYIEYLNRAAQGNLPLKAPKEETK